MAPRKRIRLSSSEPLCNGVDSNPTLQPISSNSDIEFCPNCQMPFSILLVQTKNWHLTECLEVDRTNQLECSMGNECDSTIITHYLTKTHYELAKRRCGVSNTNVGGQIMLSVLRKVSEPYGVSNMNVGDQITPSVPRKVLKPPIGNSLIVKKKTNGSVNPSQTKITSFFASCTTSAKAGTVSISKEPTRKQNQQPHLAQIFHRSLNETAVISATEIPSPSIRKCPRYKKLPDVPFVVDAFNYGEIPDISSYFLSHFHYDHYCGLSNKFRKHLYCSQITANLVNSKFHIPHSCVHALPMDEPRMVNGVEVTLIEANHCPGAVMFLFRYSNGKIVLHTGDFRGDDEMERNAALKSIHIDDLYLDTTYCQQSYDFPKQSEVLNFVVKVSKKHLEQRPKDLIVCGSYTIGKEKVFTALAQNLHLNVWAESSKRRILKCLNDKVIEQLLTEDVSQAQIHVLRMDQLSFKELHEYLSTMSKQYTGILAFKPTGWEHGSNKRRNSSSTDLSSIIPRKHGNITIYGVSYSEHSSFSELKRFVQFIKPTNIIPTVNVFGDKAKQQMEIIKSWMKSY